MPGEINSMINGEDLQSYFVVLEQPSVHPGYCLVCGNTKRPVVILKAEVDYADLGYGALLLCIECIKQAASKFPDPVPVDTILYTQHVEAIRSSRREMADELHSIADRFLGVSGDVSVYGNLDSVLEQTKSENPASTERDSTSFDRPSKQTDESISSEGPLSLPSNSSDGTAFDPFSRIRSE